MRRGWLPPLVVAGVIAGIVIASAIYTTIAGSA